MENTKEIFAILSLIIGVSANIPYALGILKGYTKPHLFSWIIWTVVCSTGTAIQIIEGAGSGAWYMIYNSLFCIIVTVASFWRGTKDIKRSDWIALIIALFAIPLWVLTDQPLWSLFIAITIDVIAYFPTIRKSWTHPEQEVASSWLMSGVVFSLSILAIEHYAVTTYLYPLVFIVVNTGLGVMLVLRRRALTAKNVA